MKTLSGLKKDLCIGRKLILKQRFNTQLNELKEVSRIQSNGVYFGKSFLEFPKASLLDYDGKTIKIYLAGFRDLTPEEKRIIDNEPKDEKQDEIDLLTDSNTMFWRRKSYYTELNKLYLFNGSKKQNGLRLTYKDGKPVIQDDTIKGKTILVYEVVGEVKNE